MSVVELLGDFFFSRTAGRTVAPQMSFSRTIEKLGRTLEPCKGIGKIVHVTSVVQL